MGRSHTKMRNKKKRATMVRVLKRARVSSRSQLLKTPRSNDGRAR